MHISLTAALAVEVQLINVPSRRPKIKMRKTNASYISARAAVVVDLYDILLFSVVCEAFRVGDRTGVRKSRHPREQRRNVLQELRSNPIQVRKICMGPK